MLVMQFREVPGYPGYHVSDTGLMLSFRPINGRGPLAVDPRVMKPTLDKDGYWSVSVHANGKKRREPIHRLVLMAFRDRPSLGCVGRHLDGNRDNNTLDNLAWGTPAENADDSKRHGTTCRGAKNASAKLTEEQVLEVRRLRATGLRYRDLMERFGVSMFCIHAICTRRTWRHV